MVHMNTINDPNNERLRALIEEAGLAQVAALAEFNDGLVKPYSLSAWKAFLSDPGSARWRRFDDALLRHAEKVLGKLKKTAG
jgi:hypothetical protein